MADLASTIDRLLKERGISGVKMSSDLGMSRSFMTELRKGRAKGVKADTAQKIADYFGVSIGYLLGEDAKEKAPAPEGGRDIEDPDIRMIARAGRKMTPEQRENLRKYAQYMFPEAFEDDDT